jgi:hypothetical protein
MTLIVERSGHDQEVARHLHTIADDPAFVAAVGDTTEPDPDGGTPRLVHLSGAIGFSAPASQTQGPGAFVMRALVDKTDLTVIVRGEGPDYEYLPGKQLVVPAGITTPITVRDGKRFILIVYDVTGCLDVDGSTKGYTVIDGTGKSIDNPPEVILFHELVHAYRKATGTETANKELQVVADHPGENDYRAAHAMPARNTGAQAHEGFGHCVVTPPKKDMPPKSVSSHHGCFVATAAYGSELAEPVQFLRELRDNILLQTPSGRAFFEEFYSHYNTFSPAIADAMRADESMNDAVRVALAEPIVRFLELATTAPEGSLQDVPEPWRSYLAREQRLFDEWTANFAPTGQHLNKLTAVDAARELAVHLRYALRDPGRRETYLSGLEAAGRIPLAATSAQADAARTILDEAGRPAEEIDRILAPAATGDNRSPSATDPTGSRDDRANRPAAGPVANMNVDETPDMGGQNPQKFLYSVTIRNNTNILADPNDPNATLVPIIIDFRMFYKRVNQAGVVFYEILNVPPGEIAVFPMGACEEMESYAFGGWAYIDPGTGVPEYTLIWSSPSMQLAGEDIGDITPAKAAAYAAEVGYADTEACADSYQIRS